MWINFKKKLGDGIIDSKINLEKIEFINFFEGRIDLSLPVRFEEDFLTQVIYKEFNENFDEIKAKLMEL